MPASKNSRHKHNLQAIPAEYFDVDEAVVEPGARSLEI